MNKRRDHVKLPITDERRTIFLDTLRSTGSFSAAARAASPHALDRHGAHSGFRGLMERDPEFAAQVEQARHDALGAVEAEIHRRAFEPPRRPVFSRGEVVGDWEDRGSSDRLLLRLAEKLDPEGWAPQSRIKSEVDVNVRGVMLAIRPQDVLLLPTDEQQTFVQLLGRIADLRGEPEAVVAEVTDLGEAS